MRTEHHACEVESDGEKWSASLPAGAVLRPGDRASWRFTFPADGGLPVAEVTVYRAGPLRRLWTIVCAIAAGRRESLSVEAPR